MSSKVLAISLAVVGLAVLGVSSVMPVPPQPVGADGTTITGSVIGWAEILRVLGGGSIGASILAFWGKIQPFIGPVIDVVHTIPSPPKPDADPQKDADQPIEKDTVELVAAVIAYAKNRSDKKLQQRLIGAVCVEIRDMMGFQNSAVATSLNSLMIAVTNVLVPVPASVKAEMTPAASGVKS